MDLRGCSSSHFILCIKDGVVTKVHNMDTCGRPSPKFKKLEEVYQHADAENTLLQLANRETKERNSYVVEEYEPNIPSKDDSLEELTLSQIKKKLRRKKRKASESVLLTPKAEDDDCDLTEPLCKFRVKGSKCSWSKMASSRKTQLVTSPSEDFAIVEVKVEVPEVEYFESGYDLTRGISESFTHEGEKCELNKALFDSLDDIMEMGDEETIENVNQPLSILSSPTNDSLYKNPTVSKSDCSQSQLYLQQTSEQADHISVARDSDLTVIDYEDVVSLKAKLPIFEEGEKCELNKDFFDSLDDIKNMEMDNEETISSDCSQSELYLQQTPEQVDNISAVQDLTLKSDDEHNEDVVSMDAKSPISEEMDNEETIASDCSRSELYLQQTPEQVDNISAVQDLTSKNDVEHNEDVVSMDAKSPISEEMDNEETIASDCSRSELYLQQTPEQVGNISAVQDLTSKIDEHNEDVVSMDAKSPISEEMDNEETIASDCSRSELYLQQTPEQVDNISAVQDLTSTIDDEHNEDVVSMDAKLPISKEMDNEETIASDCSRSELYLQQTPEQVDNISAVQNSTSTIDDEHNEGLVSMDAKSAISEENNSLASMNTDADSNSNSNSDSIFLAFNGISINQELISTVPANAASEVKLDNNDKKSEIRQPERLPLTRKFISPNSQEKLCQAMKSAESLDDMDHFKCKEQLNFGEQADNKFSSSKSDVEDTESNLHSQQESQLIQNKAVMNSKHVFKKPRSFKKGSPTRKGIVSKGCLDGPRLCRSLPHFSSGCTSIEGCTESAIAFSQRQMHDIESLASKLMSELNSMKTIVEEKMLYEAYRSTSLKNEADEVKSVIKSASKTEETAKKWLSMMARDCSRFCKIMKLNEDHNTFASGDPALGNINQNKPLEKEKKKISFADEAGGTLCDIKLYQIEEESESSLP